MKPSGPGVSFRKSFCYDYNVFNRCRGLFRLSILFTVNFDMLCFLTCSISSNLLNFLHKVVQNVVLLSFQCLQSQPQSLERFYLSTSDLRCWGPHSFSEGQWEIAQWVYRLTPWLAFLGILMDLISPNIVIKNVLQVPLVSLCILCTLDSSHSTSQESNNVSPRSQEGLITSWILAYLGLFLSSALWWIFLKL